MPELTALHERLAALAGEWEGTEELAPSPWSPGGTAQARMTLSVAAGGFALVQDYRSDTGLTGHGVFSVSGDEVLHHWFDSFGFPVEAPARGGFDGEALVVERTSPRGTNRTTFALADGELRQRIEFDEKTIAEAIYQPRR
ncbi:DUF1579 domain-containing protein [Solirubrobacter soli]|uniref:DUF1579 domain-containing protein n=1 Tax=Solirubrobacter soli TaxID=363832 RepID=UPI000427C266|nr:DUF1579 domain-containing protein [Solirubrobacter soli]